MSVLKPESAIHPMVGSIFAPPKPRVPFEALDEVENSSMGDGRESSREALAASARTSPSIRDSRAMTHAVEEAQPPRPATIMHSAEISTHSSSHRLDARRSGSAEPNAASPDDHRLHLSGKVAESEATPAKRTFTPLITSTFVPSPPIVTLRSPTKPSAEPSQSLASRSHATDDIEIRIGRIEVAAMPAAPIRSAPAKPPRRAASLDEYLKRRDGSVS